MEQRCPTTSASRFGASERGYSLIEVTIALAISLVCAAASLSWFLFQNLSMSVAVARLNADETVALSSFELYRRISQVGGGAVKPWAAVWEEDNCAARGPLPGCDGSDRLTMAELSIDVPECTLVSYNAATGDIASSEVEDYTMGPANPTMVCCMQSYAGRQVYISDENDNITARYVRSVNAANCTAITEAVQQAPTFTYTAVAGPFPSLTEGVVSPVVISTYYLDRATQTLWEWTDRNNNNAFDVGEQRHASADIFDLQFALGYDCNPKDGAIKDTDSAADEWLYNSSADAWNAGGLAGVSSKDLRQVGFVLTAGTGAGTARTTGATNSNYVSWNSPARVLTNGQLASRTRRIFMRNIKLYE